MFRAQKRSGTQLCFFLTRLCSRFLVNTAHAEAKALARSRESVNLLKRSFVRKRLNWNTLYKCLTETQEYLKSGGWEHRKNSNQYPESNARQAIGPEEKHFDATLLKCRRAPKHKKTGQQPEWCKNRHCKHVVKASSLDGDMGDILRDICPIECCKDQNMKSVYFQTLYHHSAVSEHEEKPTYPYFIRTEPCIVRQQWFLPWTPHGSCIVCIVWNLIKTIIDWFWRKKQHKAFARTKIICFLVMRHCATCIKNMRLSTSEKNWINDEMCLQRLVRYEIKVLWHKMCK